MSIDLSKDVAIALFCAFRQAERSLHYALSCPSQWAEFLEYNDDSRRSPILELIRLLEDAGAVQAEVPSRRALVRDGPLNVVRCLAGLLCNPLKRSWAFSPREAAFFRVALGHLLAILRNAEPPKEELLDLRSDCFACKYLIGRKMIGIPEIRDAESIGHFNQSEHVAARSTLREIPHFEVNRRRVVNLPEKWRK